jgi:hypothetical protein
MATRATIGMVTAEGYIRYIYSHWDGYLDGVGATLLENYNTTAARDGRCQLARRHYRGK